MFHFCIFLSYYLVLSIIFTDCFGRFLGDNSEEYTPSLPKIIFAQATGGIIAGATASCITNPLDTIKTRLQVFITLLNTRFFLLHEFVFFGHQCSVDANSSI